MIKKTIYKKYLPILIIVFIASILRFYHLGEKSLWKDEVYSMVEAQKSIVQIFTTKTYFFGYVPIHHFFHHLPLYFSRSEFAVRFPAVIFGIATVFIIFKLGEKYFNRQTGLIASFLLTVSVFHLQYSREVRYYVYIIFFSAVSLLFLVNYINHKKKKDLLFFVFTCLLNIMTQSTALFIVGCEVIYIIFYFIFWEKRLLGQIFNNKKITPKRIIFLTGSLLAVLLGLVFINSFKELFAGLAIRPAMPPNMFIPYFFINLSGSQELAILYCLLFAVGSVGSFRAKNRHLWLFFILMIIPTGFYYYIRPVQFGFNLRYVSFVILPYLLLISYGISTMFNNKKYLTVVILLIIAGFSVKPLSLYYSWNRGDWRGVANYINKEKSSGDVVIVEGVSYRMLLDYYLQSKKDGLRIKTVHESLDPVAYPFRVFYLQHDFVTPEGKANPQGVFLTDYQKIVNFEAPISPMYVFVSEPIVFWQEAEKNYFNEDGWLVSDIWTQIIMSIDSVPFPQGKISYKIKSPKDGYYDLYANLWWGNTRCRLDYEIDNSGLKKGLYPFVNEEKDFRYKEGKVFSEFLAEREHELTFQVVTEASGSGRYQSLDYFYLKSSKRQI